MLKKHHFIIFIYSILKGMLGNVSIIKNINSKMYQITKIAEKLIFKN